MEEKHRTPRQETSRPDMQVVQDRVKRLKYDLTWYPKNKLYGPTKKKLLEIKKDLLDCILSIDEAVNSDVDTSSTVDLDSNWDATQQCNNTVINETDLTCDLTSSLDTIDNHETLEEVEQYNPKYIMSTFRRRLVDNTNTSFGIIQVSRMWFTIVLWFEKRYSRDSSNSQFKYKASNICNWIDLILIAAGYAIHTRIFNSFINEFNSWIETLGTDKDRNWILPQNIMNIKKSGNYIYTAESVLLEQMIKSLLYDSTFYASLLHSVKNTVLQNRDYTEEELSIENMIENNEGKWTITSDFNIDKYLSGGRSSV